MASIAPNAARRGQGGYTLVEVIVCLVIASIVILSLALGLLASATADSVSNAQQRANLALTSFVENLKYAPPGAGCVPVSDPPPSSGSGGTTTSSHARTMLQQAVAEPEVADWIARGAVFTITDVEYARWQVSGAAAEDFSAACDAPGPTSPNLSRPVPYYPVIRVTVKACVTSTASSSTCGDSTVVRTQVTKRGERT